MFKNLSQHFGQDGLAPTDKAHRSLGLGGTIALWLGANVVVTTILTGMLLVPDLKFTQAMLIVLIGSGIGILPLVLVGLMGQRSGLTTMVLARGSYGVHGAKLPSLVNLLTLLAWSWIQALLAGMSLNYAVEHLTGYSNLPLFTILCETLVLLIALRGHLGIERVERWAAIGMLLLAGAVFYVMGQQFEFASLLAMPTEPRNEITPGNFIFRTREFEQMEMEYFVPPADSAKWYDYWCETRMQWYIDLGIPADMLRLRAHEADELSHYSSGTSDIEFKFPWGWGELEGIAQRTDFDLNRHAEFSKQKLDYFDQATNERYVPYVVEPAAGANRTMAAFLLAAYDEDVVNDEPRTVLRLHPRLAPYQVAILPLSKKESLTPLADQIFSTLSKRYYCDYDETQAIGRRYRRQDEIGTPYCITVDFDSLEDGQVTIRERDTTQQERVSIDRLEQVLSEKLGF